MCKFPGKFDPIRVDNNMPIVDILIRPWYTQTIKQMF